MAKKWLIQRNNKGFGLFFSNIRRICGIDIDPVYVTPAVTRQTSTTASNDNTSTLGLILDNQEINNNGHKNAQTNNETEEDDDDWDDDDDWELMNLPQTEEERDANRILGFGQ